MISAWLQAVVIGALWTGAQKGFALCSMTGFLLPHYGYSAYAASALLFLGPPRWLGGLAVVLSGNRAAWVGAIAGWAWGWARGPHSGAKLLLLLGLAGAGVIGGNALKPRGAVGDVVRVHIWKAAARSVARNPWTGVGRGQFCIGVDGNAVTETHSDVLQLAVDYGLVAAAAAVGLVLWGLWTLPASPAKTTLVCLSVQSLFDNRLTVSVACAGLYAAVWLCALARLDAPPSTQKR